MKKNTLVLGLLAVTTLPAAADNFYVYGDAGRSKFSSIVDDTDNALNLGVGYQVNNIFSVELGYHDLGKLITAELIYGPGVHGAASVLDSKAIQFSAIAKLPITDALSVYGRLGYAHMQGDLTFHTYAKDTQIYTTTSGSMSENKATFGVGADFKINEKISWRANYIKFGDTHISLATIGASYAF